tara:strand:- start:138 stop:605 length:468 start_codon:yes stop_codon:yes gene_type:complete
MTKYLLLFIGLAWGQPLNFKNNNETIRIETGEKLQLNGDKYTLVKTVNSKEYVVVEKHKSSIQDTLKFDSIVSFKYYEKSLKSFSSNTIKCTKYGVLIGAIAGVPEGINYGFHWVILGGILHGGLGALCGAVYSMLRPIASEQIILEKEGWYISN